MAQPKEHSNQINFLPNEDFSVLELKAYAKYDPLLSPEQPSTSNVWGHDKGWMLVGTGEVTNPDKNDKKACGKFYGVKGCINVDGHNMTTLTASGKPVNHKGMMFGRKQFRYCNNPRCPICYKHGYANREAGRAEARLKKGEKRFGKVEHLVFSPPRVDMPLVETPEGERKYRQTKLKKALDARGIMGGSIVFHPFRYANREEAEKKGVPFGWYYSPHYHVTGYVKGGYSRCRGCLHNNWFDRGRCLSCGGFVGRCQRANEKDGFIVKVKAERSSIWGTLRYQLDHCGVAIEEKGYHIVTWFGVVSYRALKLTKEDFIEVGFEHKLCPLCQRELEDLWYLGSDFDRLAKEFWIKEFEEPFLDKDGNPLWKIKDKKKYGESY